MCVCVYARLADEPYRSIIDVRIVSTRIAYRLRFLGSIKSPFTLQVLHLRLIDVHVEALLLVLLGEKPEQSRIVVSRERARPNSAQVTLILPDELRADGPELDVLLHLRARLQIEPFFRRLEPPVVQAVLNAEKRLDIDEMILVVVGVLVADRESANGAELRYGDDPIG